MPSLKCKTKQPRVLNWMYNNLPAVWHQCHEEDFFRPLLLNYRSCLKQCCVCQDPQSYCHAYNASTICSLCVFVCTAGDSLSLYENSSPRILRWRADWET